MNSPTERRARYDLAHLGEAIGDSSRSAILISLMGGLARPASDLARVAGVSPSTATSHLQRLLDAGLIVVRPAGRHRYYALAGPEVAHIVETLATCVSKEKRNAISPGRAPLDKFSMARTCYGHLAGRLAIAFWARARSDKWVRWSDISVSLRPRGIERLAGLEIQRVAKGALQGRPCLDWSERTPHVAGPLGVAICDAFLAQGWVARVGDGRALRVTSRGEKQLRSLGIDWPS